MYKIRHDKILGIIVKEITNLWGIAESRTSSAATYECVHGKLLVDLTMPTDEPLTARRLDNILCINQTNKIWILDVACTWDPLLEERDREKVAKYIPLAADMGKRVPRWHVKVGALVVGSLGTIKSLRSQLAQLQLWKASELDRILSDKIQSTYCSNPTH